MPRTDRLLRGLLTAAIAGALTLAPVVAAGAKPLPDAGAASPIAAADTRAATRLHGWRTSATSVKAGKRFVVHLRVSGGTRAVRLERRVAGEWRVLDGARTSAAGRVTLVWRPKTAKSQVVLRVHVPATATRAAVRSTPHRVRVVQPAAASVPVPTVSATAAPTPTASATTSPDEALRARLLVLVNQARATPRTCGSTEYPAAPALVRSDALDRAAGDYAEKMAAEDFFAHESPDGSTMSSRLNAVGVRNTTMRENIAAGYRTAEDVMAGWLQSSGHCANLMAADVRRVGLGHATTSTAKYGSYWVQDFAG